MESLAAPQRHQGPSGRICEAHESREDTLGIHRVWPCLRVTLAVFIVTFTLDPYATVNVILGGVLQYPMINLVSIYPMATVVLVDYSHSYFNRALIAETVHCRAAPNNDAETPQLETTIDSAHGNESSEASSILSGIRYVARYQRSTSNNEPTLTHAFMTQTSV